MLLNDILDRLENQLEYIEHSLPWGWGAGEELFDNVGSCLGERINQEVGLAIEEAMNALPMLMGIAREWVLLREEQRRVGLS